MVTWHAPDDLLLAYASGALGEAMSLAVATHLALDPVARARAAAFEAVGGALVEELPPAPLSADALAATLAALDSESAAPATPRSQRERAAAEERPRLPQPLRGHLGQDLAGLTWRRLLPGVEEAVLPPLKGGRARLLRIAPHRGVPQHSHRGQELTLVLEGAYRDSDGSLYARGDLQLADPSIDHRPKVESPDPCLCLAVTDAPLRFTGRFGRLLNPFIRYA